MIKPLSTSCKGPMAVRTSPRLQTGTASRELHLRLYEADQQIICRWQAFATPTAEKKLPRRDWRQGLTSGLIVWCAS